MEYRTMYLPAFMLSIGLVAGYNIPESGSASDSDPIQQTMKAQSIDEPGGKLSSNANARIASGTEAKSSPQDCDKEQFASVNLKSRTEQSLIDPREKVKDLLEQIRAVSDGGADSANLDKIAGTETMFLSQLEQSPELVNPLLSSYAKMPENSSKEFLRSMLSASGYAEVERHALTQFIQGDAETQEQWLQLLASTGVNTQENRSVLLEAMGNMESSESIVTALNAFSPEIVSSEEKINMVNELEIYATHSDELIRSAGVEALSQWADKENSDFIETALTDESQTVRQSAVYSAYTSGIQSEIIKAELIHIVEDEDQPFTLRLDSHDALSTYSLQGDEYEKYHQFHLDIEANQQDTGAAKG